MKFTKTLWLNVILLLAVSCGAVALTGCSEPAGEESHSHADGEEHEKEHGDEAGHSGDTVVSFEDALAELSEMKTVICKAFADETPDDAHDALHDVGHLLESLPELASKDLKLDEAAMTSLDAAVEALFDGFGKLDETFHGGEEVDAKQIEEELTKAIDQLKQAVK